MNYQVLERYALAPNSVDDLKVVVVATDRPRNNDSDTHAAVNDSFAVRVIAGL